MRATRRAVLTDAHNGLLGNGYAQDMGQIPDAGNPSNPEGVETAFYLKAKSQHKHIHT